MTFYKEIKQIIRMNEICSKEKTNEEEGKEEKEFLKEYDPIVS